MTLIWLPEARDDIQRLYEFLLDKNPSAAQRAVRSIRTGAERLIEAPRIGLRMDDDTERREWLIPFGAGGYVLRYRIHGEQSIVIVRVWHSREERL